MCAVLEHYRCEWLVLDEYSFALIEFTIPGLFYVLNVKVLDIREDHRHRGGTIRVIQAFQYLYDLNRVDCLYILQVSRS